MASPLLLHPTSRSRAAVARRAHNPKVGGSNPPFATRLKKAVKGKLLAAFLFITKSFHSIKQSLKAKKQIRASWLFFNNSFLLSKKSCGKYFFFFYFSKTLALIKFIRLYSYK
jgi:hypothetical protein